MFNNNSFLLFSIRLLEKSQAKAIMRDQGIFKGSSPDPPTQGRESREDWTSCPISVLPGKAEVITVQGQNLSEYWSHRHLTPTHLVL